MSIRSDIEEEIEARDRAKKEISLLESMMNQGCFSREYSNEVKSKIYSLRFEHDIPDYDEGMSGFKDW